jgi:hypothetical protein
MFVKPRHGRPKTKGLPTDADVCELAHLRGVLPDPRNQWPVQARQFNALADWIDDQLEADKPPKWVARVAASAIREGAKEIAEAWVWQ